MSPSLSETPVSYGSVARRFALMAVAMLAAVLVAISTLMALVAEGRSRDRIVLGVSDKIQAVAVSIDAFDTTARNLTDRAYQPFRQKFVAPFELDTAAQQLRSQVGVLNGAFTEVDDFQQTTGGVATVFMRKGEDFERVTTSLKKENGERAMGTLLARDHPAYPLMLAGKTYTGRAKLFGKHYMTHYEALKDNAGQVVGILFIGFDIGHFQTSIDQIVADAKFFQSGGAVVIDPRGSAAEAVFVSHPTAAGKKVLEVVPQAESLLRDLKEAPDGFVRGGSPMSGASLEQPWHVMRPTKAGGWWVVAEVSDDEAMATHWATIYAFWVLLGGATVVMGLGLYLLVRRQISAPLADLTTAVTSVAQGDLTHTFHSRRRDDVGRLVHEVEGMRQRFVEMMRELRSASDSIGVASSEIASGNQDLSSRTEQAASSLQQTAASMEQLTSTVQSSADAARQANQLAASASEIAVRGGQVVSQVVTTMEEINHSSKKINDIIGTIDGIAFQTNILALNAAVEAARAGEQGRGFAVVAAEVRNLAQRSAEAAREIKGLIGTSVDKVEAGTRLVDEAGQTMGEIVASVQRVTDIIGEITAASGEQSDGIGQVNVAVTQLDQMTQQNAALVEESAAAAASLRDQAARLAQVVQVFRVGASGAAVVPARTAPAVVKAAAKPAPVAAPAPTPSTPVVAMAAPVPRPAPVERPRAAVPSLPAPAPRTVAPASAAEGEWENF